MTATFQTRSASLAEDFGLNYATWLFGEEALAALPRYVRGPNKGKIKAYVHWTKCETKGYSREYQRAFGVGQLAAAKITGFPLSYSTALDGRWMGRKQALSGNSYHLGPQAREREIAEQAKLAADRAEEIAEWRAEQAAKGV